MINKEEEKKKILRLLYKGNGLSRLDINTVLRIRQTTLQEIISALVSQNLLHEPERNSKKTGARSPKLYINPEFGNLLGIDLGSNCIKTVITDFNGIVLYKIKGSYKTLKDKDSLLNETFSMLKKIKGENPELWNKIIGIGIADPGPVDIKNGISLFAYNIRNWANVPTAEIFGGKYMRPVSVITASHAKAMSEHFFNNSDVSSLFVVDMGHGVGAAYIYNHELFTGYTHTEMEFGHILVNENGQQCSCGRNGCLEAEIGSMSILEKFREKIADGAQSIVSQDADTGKITLEHIYASFLKNDPVSVSLIHEVAEHLAKGLSYVIQLVNPEKIIIHGPITALDGKIDGYVKHSLYKYCFPSVVDKMEISCSKLDEFSAALGACIAIRSKLFF